MVTIFLAMMFGFAMLMALHVVLMSRGSAVFHYRMALIDKVGEANNATIDSVGVVSTPAEWAVRFKACNEICEARWNWFHSVTYDQMAWQFWKPLPEFYPPMPNGDSEEWPSVIDAPVA